MDPTTQGPSATHPISLKAITEQAERATSIVAQARGVMLAPDARKLPPTFSATQLIERLKIERSQYDYRVRNPGGLPTGRLTSTGARREFTLSEMRQWARHYRAGHLRPEGGEAITISTAHFKGGSSKTTTATTLAQGLSMRGHKVLVVDVDPQGSMTTLFGFLPDAEVDVTQTLLPLLSGDEPDVNYAIRPTYWDGVDLVPSSSPLFSAEFILPTRQLKEASFQFWRTLDYGLDPIRSKYDVIICDTPPSLSFLTVNALMASDGIIMPLPPSNLDFASSAQFWDLFKDLADDFAGRGAGKDFAFINILLSKVKYAAPKDNTGQSTAIIREWIQAAYAERVLPVEIPDVEAVRTASKEFGTVYDASRDNASTRTFKSAFEAYDRFVDLIEQQMETFWQRQVEVEVATQKKGQGIAFKIPDHVEEPEVTSEPQADVKPALPRTGVGMLSRMLSGAAADTEAVSKLNAEIEKLKLQVGEQLIDPRQIALTRWADRHPDSFSSQAFAELKQEIESAGGNVQAIKVRPVRGAAAEQPEGPRFELVYGSRRTRACLELGLPVRAVVDENVDDQALYVQMQRENRGRSNLSAWEQGVSYHKALNEGLFPSARRLAEQIGLDHSNVAKALRVAELPQEIVGAFRSPVDIQFRWAVALDKAYQQDPDAVLSAARLLAGRSPKPAAAEVFRSLTEAVSAKGKPKAKEASRAFVIADGKKGVIRAGKGGAVTVELPRGVLPPARWAAFETALQKLLSDLPEAP